MNPDAFRENIRQVITRILKTSKHSRNIEKSIFNNSLQIANSKNIVKKWENQYFVLIYVDRFRSVYSNLKDPTIAKRLETVEFKAHEIGGLTHQDLSPERWEKLIYEKNMKDKNKYTPTSEGNTDVFTCRKCKSNKCNYFQLQTRSADEPMTTYVTCVNCGNRWKC
jgi:transcription elongation factor S-II